MKLHVPGIKTFILRRYGSLLLTLACLVVFQPFVVTTAGKVLIEILLIGALLAGLRAIEIKQGLLRFEVALLIVSLLCNFSGIVFDHHVLFGLGLAGETLFLFIVAITILVDLFQTKKITGDTQSGAVCVYLLIGLTWSYLYLLVEFCFPGSFSFTQDQARMQMWLSKEFYPLLLFQPGDDDYGRIRGDASDEYCGANPRDSGGDRGADLFDDPGGASGGPAFIASAG